MARCGEAWRGMARLGVARLVIAGIRTRQGGARRGGVDFLPCRKPNPEGETLRDRALSLFRARRAD